MTAESLPWVYVTGGLMGLFVGGELFVRSAIDMGRRSGLSPLFVGLAIVGFGTSAAELAVSVSAALDGAADIALANVVGSNIANIALVLGLTASITALAVESGSLKRDIPVMIGVTAVLLAFLLDDQIDRLEGGVLLLILCLYLAVAWQQSRERDASSSGNGSAASASDHDDVKGEIPVVRSWARILVFLVFGAILLALGSQFLVDGAIAISIRFGVSQAVIGATVVAIGTSLPEIVASTLAAIRGHTALAIGNIVGSNIWNIVCVLGTTSLIINLPRGGVSWHMLLFMAVVSLLLYLLASTGRRVSRPEGIILLLVYVGYQGWLFM